MLRPNRVRSMQGEQGVRGRRDQGVKVQRTRRTERKLARLRGFEPDTIFGLWRKRCQGTILALESVSWRLTGSKRPAKFQPRTYIQCAKTG